MLPPTAASASVSLGEKPAPQSWREKMLGTRVCFTRESKKGSRLSSGWWQEEAKAGQGCVSAIPSPWALRAQGSSLGRATVLLGIPAPHAAGAGLQVTSSAAGWAPKGPRRSRERGD